MKILNLIKSKISNKDKILILGFGKEGISTYKVIRKIFLFKKIFIADFNKKIEPFFNKNFFDKNVVFFLGENYLKEISNFDIIFKSPGISLKNIKINEKKILTQTQLFFEIYKEKIIGITGTKGKSTTSQLTFNIFKNYFSDVLLVGNIGIPVFDVLNKITDKTIFIYELSSHQLEFVENSPKYSILLNIYKEHLDFYKSYLEYQNAKFNIFKFQKKFDFSIYYADNEIIKNRISNFIKAENKYSFTTENNFSKKNAYFKEKKIYLKINTELKKFETSDIKIPGIHNIKNVMASLIISKIFNIPYEIIKKEIKSFSGLPHRLEYFGKFNEISFYNDSISTIPESTIAAILSIKRVNSIIIGGMDRGIDYSNLINFLKNSEIENIIFIDETGKKLYSEMKQKFIKNKFLYMSDNLKKCVEIAFKKTKKNHNVLFSPGASSYNMFKNFEERGNVFKNTVKNLAFFEKKIF